MSSNLSYFPSFISLFYKLLLITLLLISDYSKWKHLPSTLSLEILGLWLCKSGWGREELLLAVMFLGFPVASGSLSSSWTRQRPQVAASKASVQWIQPHPCCSGAKSCPTLCHPMNCSRPGFLVFHCLPEFAQIHVHRVSDAIKSSHLLLPPSPPAVNLPQYQGLFQWVGSSAHQAPPERQGSGSAPPLTWVPGPRGLPLSSEVPASEQWCSLLRVSCPWGPFSKFPTFNN